jgi:hypothetical protein
MERTQETKSADHPLDANKSASTATDIPQLLANWGFPKIGVGFSIINHPAIWGTPILGLLVK